MEAKNETAKEDKRMYDTILEAVCGYVENHGDDEENHEIIFNIDSDPFMVRFRITVRPDNGIFTVLSQLEFNVPEENRKTYALELCRLVYSDLFVGTFDFDPDSGITVFRVSEIYRNSLISKEICIDIFKYVYEMVTKYNERLFRLSRGENPDKA